MIFILHGENITRSRNAVLGLQQKLGFDARMEFAVVDIGPQQLLDKCLSFDIFGKPPFIVLDISQAGRMNLKEYAEILESVPAETVLVVLSGRKLPKNNVFIKNASGWRAKEVFSAVQPASNVFNFVDAVFFGKRDVAYKELNKLILEGEDAFKLFAMLLYGLRNVAFYIFDSPNLRSMAPFVKNKAKRQARKFSEDSVKALYAKFYELDRGVKFGEVQPEMLVPLAMEAVLAGNEKE